MERDTSLDVDHMLEAIANIEADIAGYDFERFRQDRRARQLVERNLEILSQASRRLPQTAKEAERQIQWRAIAGIGNVIRHDYHETYPRCWGKPAARICSLSRRRSLACARRSACSSAAGNPIRRTGIRAAAPRR